MPEAEVDLVAAILAERIVFDAEIKAVVDMNTAVALADLIVRDHHTTGQVIQIDSRVVRTIGIVGLVCARADDMIAPYLADQRKGIVVGPRIDRAAVGQHLAAVLHRIVQNPRIAMEADADIAGILDRIAFHQHPGGLLHVDCRQTVGRRVHYTAMRNPVVPNRQPLRLNRREAILATAFDRGLHDTHIFARHDRHAIAAGIAHHQAGQFDMLAVDDPHPVQAAMRNTQAVDADMLRAGDMQAIVEARNFHIGGSPAAGKAQQQLACLAVENPCVGIGQHPGFAAQIEAVSLACREPGRSVQHKPPIGRLIQLPFLDHPVHGSQMDRCLGQVTPRHPIGNGRKILAGTVHAVRQQIGIARVTRGREIVAIQKNGARREVEHGRQIAVGTQRPAVHRDGGIDHRRCRAIRPIGPHHNGLFRGSAADQRKRLVPDGVAAQRKRVAGQQLYHAGLAKRLPRAVAVRSRLRGFAAPGVIAMIEIDKIVLRESRRGTQQNESGQYQAGNATAHDWMGVSSGKPRKLRSLRRARYASMPARNAHGDA